MHGVKRKSSSVFDRLKEDGKKRSKRLKASISLRMETPESPIRIHDEIDIG